MMKRATLLSFALCFSAGWLRASESTARTQTFIFDHEQSKSDGIRIEPSDTYNEQRGYGFDLGTKPVGGSPFFFSVTEPEGSYRVTIKFGTTESSSATTVKAESRQLMLEAVETKPNEYVTRKFIVNIRNSSLPPPPKNAPGGSSVLLNEREKGLLRWDQKLTLEFDGKHPVISAINITPSPETPVLYLAGDSTVTDQPTEPAASWGQMLPRFLTGVAVANHAESGETLKSFISELRLAKILSTIKAGDYLFIQFAHNDEKKQWPQTYVEAETTYKDYLRIFIAEARLRGATPVLVTPMQRRTFDAGGKIKNSHGNYPAAMQELARDEHVALIDLERMSVAFYEALGPDHAPLAFNQQGRDATHHDNYGAYELAKCVASGIRKTELPLANNIVSEVENFDPAKPDAPGSFTLPASPSAAAVELRGN